MVLTLVIHRQLTSLAEIFDGLVHGLHNILQANSGRTLDKSRFSGNKSLHEENDLRERPSMMLLPANFKLAEISLLPPVRRWSCFDLFFISMGELGRKFQPFCVMDYTILCS
jgi:hypothetical protein